MAASRKKSSSSKQRRVRGGGIAMPNIVIGHSADREAKEAEKLSKKAAKSASASNKTGRRLNKAAEHVEYSRDTLRRMLELVTNKTKHGTDGRRLTDYTQRAGGINEKLLEKCDAIKNANTCRASSQCGTEKDGKTCEPFTWQGVHDLTTTDGLLAALQDMVDMEQRDTGDDATQKQFKIPPRHWFDAESFTKHSMIKKWAENLHNLEVENMLPYRCIDAKTGSIERQCFDSMLERLNGDIRKHYIGFTINAADTSEKQSITDILKAIWYEKADDSKHLAFKANAAAENQHKRVSDPRYRYISFTMMGGPDADARVSEDSELKVLNANGNYTSTIFIDRRHKTIQEFNAHGLKLVADSQSVLGQIWKVLGDEFLAGSESALRQWVQDDSVLQPQHLIAEDHDDGIYHLWFITERLLRGSSKTSAALLKRLTPTMMRKREQSLFRRRFFEEFSDNNAPVQRAAGGKKSAKAQTEDEKLQSQVEANNESGSAVYQIYIPDGNGDTVKKIQV
jgi:hypothetical protein